MIFYHLQFNVVAKKFKTKYTIKIYNCFSNDISCSSQKFEITINEK